MKAVQVTAHGGPEVLELRDVDVPVPGPSDLLVAVDYAGVNFIDVYRRTGQQPTVPPFTAGLEGSGIVVEVGSEVVDFRPGDVVAWAWSAGSYAEQALVPEDKAVKVPAGVSTRVAAAAMLQGMTGHYLTETVYRGEPGQFALVHAAAGGMGLLLCQLLAGKGMTVVGTVSSAAKETLAREAGAQHVVRYDQDDFVVAVKEITDGAGVHVVYDSVGMATFEGSLSSLHPRGYLALFGASSGAVPPFDLQRLAAMGSLVVSRPTLTHFIASKDENRWRGEAVFGWVADGRLSVRIGHEYPLADAASAHRDLEARRTTGKLILSTT